MNAANGNLDSDQSGDHRQRPRAWISLFLLILALILSGCARQGVKPDRSDAELPAGSGQIASDEVAAPTRVSASDVAEAGEDQVWERLRRGFQLEHIKHPRIKKEIRRLQRSPNAFLALMARSEPFIYHILGEVEAAGMPSELALLPAVESGFRPYAYSPDGAAGLWQFMPATGRMLGLEQDWWYDKRRNIQASTGAATIYLEKLQQRFPGDWLHTLAAYNAGAYKVKRAIRRAKRRSEPTDFWSLDLPGETDRYVPRLLAVAAVVADPGAYGLELPQIRNQPYFAAAGTGGQIDLSIAAQLAGMPVEDLLALNAGHKRWASRPDGPHELLLPIEKIAIFESALAKLPADQRVRWQLYRIKPGDSLNRIARQHGVSADAIRRSNGLRDSRIRAGKELLIPLSDSTVFAGSLSNKQSRQRLRYRVRKGDSLYTIARRFQVSVTDLKRWNQVGRYIRPGERLTVFVDPDA